MGYDGNVVCSCLRADLEDCVGAKGERSAKVGAEVEGRTHAQSFHPST